MTTAYNPSQTSSVTSGPAGGASQDPVASGLVNLPADQMAPATTPAAWGLTAQLLNQPLYAGPSTTSVRVSALKRNQLLGQIADKLGVKTQRGKSLEEQIINQLARQHGIQTYLAPSVSSKGGKVSSTPEGTRSDAQVLGDVLTKLGIVGANPKNKMALPKSLEDGNVLGQLATKLGVEVNGNVNVTNQPTTTVGKAASQIYGMNASQISALQAQLWEGGFYDVNVEGVGGYAGPDAKKITPGNLDPYTMKAFGTLLTQTAQSGQKISWTDALNQASGTNAQGVPSGSSGSALTIQDLITQNATGASQASIPKVTVATPDQMMNTLQTYFESKLGRMPTRAELTQFTGQYDQSQLDNSKYIDPTNLPTDFSDTGVSLVPGVARPMNAAVEFAQSNGTEYMGHQIANAGALMLNAIRQPGGLGANPNITTAG